MQVRIHPSALTILAIRFCAFTVRISLGLRHQASDYRHPGPVCSVISGEYGFRRARNRTFVLERISQWIFLARTRMAEYCEPVRKGKRHMFNSNCQQNMPNPKARADRCVGAFINLQQGLAVVEITKQGEALAVYGVKKLSQFCGRLIACGSHHGVSQPC